MLIRAITFSVSISSLGITISIVFRITKRFWVSPRFFLVLFGVFVLHHFRSVLAQPHTSSPSVLDHSLSFGDLTGLKLLCSSTMGAEKEIHCLWPRKIHCFAIILKQCGVCCQLRQITMEPHSGACLVGFKLGLSYRYHFYYR